MHHSTLLDPTVLKQWEIAGPTSSCGDLSLFAKHTRAIRMYATAGYSTDDFLTAFRRFTSHHGNPLLIVSDAGSQLKKAGKVIEGDPACLDWSLIQGGAAKNGTKWTCVEPGCQ